MKQSAKRSLSMLLALIFVVAAFLVFFDLIQPTYADLQFKKGTEASNQALLLNEQTLITQAKNLVSQYNNTSQVQSNLALAMPSGPNVAGALAAIYGLSQSSDISVRNLSVGTPIALLSASSSSNLSKPMGTIPIQVAATGNYENLKNYLTGLETNIRLFDVTAFSMQPVPALGTTLRGVPVQTPNAFTFRFTITTYYQVP